ncbi:MAG: pyruvate dehydrogenase (acetyl-transferring), homodimeric type, partial [Desulfobacterales bacterium]
HPHRAPRKSFIEEQLSGAQGIFVAASDYLKALPAMMAKWVPGRLLLLGTDGYGRSESRAALRDFFEVDARHIAYTALCGLAAEKRIEANVLKKARQALEIDPEKLNPRRH